MSRQMQQSVSGASESIQKPLAGLAKGALNVVGSAAAAVAKTTAAALGAATAGVVAFGKSAIDAGSKFDSSMSQVAATMGKTVDEIGDLRDFAMEMGATTAFSASEAADALNYMALAGYDADQAMQALPNVLNLAAAGNIDLAYASDMVTDAQSALGLSMSESAQLVDKMAMASSKSNTSVAQLGEAILTVGGTAKNMAGGTTELATALGILADNGVKGAEGGTALRNIILSLSAPTDKAATELENLGVSAYDSEGKLRPLNDIFGDLNDSLSTMTQGEQTQALNTIFNKVDLKSVNALLANTGERFDELSGYIDNASGAAERMAQTQLDNLAGDITIFKSALEGAQITLSDQLTPALRNLVQFGTQGITDLTNAFSTGGLTGMMEAASGIITDLIGMLVEQLPNLINVGMQVLSAVGDGILQNLPLILEAGKQMLDQLATGLMENLPAIADGAVEIVTMLLDTLLEMLPDLLQMGIDLLLELADGLAQALPELVPVAIDAILTLIDGLLDNLDQLAEAALELILALADGLIKALPVLLSKVPVIIYKLSTAIVGLIKELWEAGRELLKNLVEGIVAVFPDLVKAGKEVPAKILGVIGDALGKFADMGRQVVEGLWQGIKDAGNWLKDKLSGWVSGIVDNVKGLFGIHSPSKVFAKIGEMLSAGLADGVEEESGGVLEAFEELSDKSLKQVKSWLSDQKKLVSVSAAEEIKIWEAMREKYKAGSEERQEIDQNYLLAKKSLNDQLQTLEQNYLDKVKTANEELAKSIEELNQKYADAVDARTQAIVGSMSLFDEFEANQKVSGRELLQNLQSQVDGMREWSDNIRMLAERGIEDGLLQELQEMGPSAAGEIAALNKMSDEQLSQYVTLWKEKNKIARDQAVYELRGLQEDTKKEIAQLEKQTSDLLASYTEEYRTEFEKLTGELFTIGGDTMKNLWGGMDSQREMVLSNVIKLCDELKAQFDSVRESYESLGNMDSYSEASTSSYSGGVSSRSGGLDTAAAYGRMAGAVASERQQVTASVSAKANRPAPSKQPANNVTNLYQTNEFNQPVKTPAETARAVKRVGRELLSAR